MTQKLFSSSEAAQAMAAHLTGDAACAVLRVNTDSRDVRPGDLFVAIRGERFDGHDFVDGALQGGAVAALVTHEYAAAHPALPAGCCLLAVDDTVLALGRLAAWRRSKCDIPLIGVTGSNGKTSVKEMLASILRQHFGTEAVLATQGNLNNHLGVPQMLLRLTEQHRCAVLEMGMNHFDEIRYLTRMARPDVALVNNAGNAHLEHLGSVAGVAQAKGEIFEGLDETGVAIINADDAFADYWASLNPQRKMLRFGLEAADVHAAGLVLEPLHSRFSLITPAGDVAIQLAIPGLHNVRNALAAAASALALALPLSAIAAGLNAYGGTQGRLQTKRAHHGATLIDDTYNANPDSMRAAVDVLARLPEPRWLVLGDMGEVGNDAARHHAELGTYARQAGVRRLLATGEAMRQAVESFGEGAGWYPDHAALIAALRSELTPDGTVLCKGSRFMRMEQVIEALAASSADNVKGAV